MPDYFTLPELRAMPDVGNTTTYPDARCESASAYIVGVIEREVGTSFIGRTVTDEVYDGKGADGITLRKGYVLSASVAKIDGVTITDTLVVRQGVLYRVPTGSTSPVAWPSGTANIKVTYSAGYSATVPGDVKEQALKATRAHLLAGGEASSMNERRTSLNGEMGITNFTVAGKDRPTGYPEFDAMIAGWKSRLDVLGFA